LEVGKETFKNLKMEIKYCQAADKEHALVRQAFAT
jgi:hypothetical protein